MSFTTILNLTGSRPKMLTSDIFVVIRLFTFQIFAMFFNVSTPLCKLSSESAIMTRSSAKSMVFLFVVFEAFARGSEVQLVTSPTQSPYSPARFATYHN